jgi:hypothetical protein
MTIQRYVTYDNTTGEISNVFTVDDIFPNAISDLYYNIPVNNTLALCDHDDDPMIIYFPSGVKTFKPYFVDYNSWNHTVGSADGLSSITFGTSLPNPTSCNIITPKQVKNIAPIDITSGTATITTTVPGTYIVKFSQFPYFDYEEAITFVSGNVTYINVPKVSIIVGMKIPTIMSTQYNYISVPTASLVIDMKTVGVFASNTKLVVVPKMSNLVIGMKTPITNKTENNAIDILNFSFLINSSTPTISITKNNFIDVNLLSLSIAMWEPIINP